jgi:class 3 adenylate cyclase
MNEGSGELAPSTRIGDEDRAHTVELLRGHTSEGRLSLDEFSERVGLALSAQSRADLEGVVADLPVEAPAPGLDQRRRKVTRWVVAVMSGSARKGRWRTGTTVNAVAFMGGCELDFRQADIEGPELIVNAVAFMGGIDIVVPEGIEVELSGIPIMGGKHMKLADVPILPGSPRIVVRAFSFMGGVSVKSRPDGQARLPLEGAAERLQQRLEAGADHLQRALPLQVDDERTQRIQREMDRIEQGMKIAERHVQRSAQRLQRTMARWDERWGLPVDRQEEEALPTDNELAAVPTAPDGTVTIMFSDICGYTQMTEAIGDLATRDVLHSYQRIVRGQLVVYGGYEVKTQGDGFMVAFGGASRALRCAIAIQRALHDYNKEHAELPIQVHEGLHTGETVRDGGDFLGRTVIIASRITGEAGAGEILVSSLLKELADGPREFRFGEARQAELKGLSAVQTLYPVEWRV